MKIAETVSELIGETPIIELTNIEKAFDLKAHIYAKLEYFNPSGSVKDRAAFYMLSTAEKEGKVDKDTVIVEPTSGNTGIGLASLCASKGYKLILTMPSSMSKERQKLLKIYGAELVLTEPSKGMRGAVEKANEIASAYEKSFIPSQFDNEANARAHFETTAPEIYKAMNGDVSAIVAGIGTGGTVTGIGRYFRKNSKDTKIYGVEPLSSPLLTKGTAGGHGIQGIGANFVPSVLDRTILDGVLDISDKEAFDLAVMIPKTEGIFVGISSGAAVSGAIELAKSGKYDGKNIVCILPDSGDRYLSSPIFGE